MSDKIPYSKVDKKSVNSTTTTTKTTKTSSPSQNGKGSKPRPYSNIANYLNNYDEINWG